MDPNNEFGNVAGKIETHFTVTALAVFFIGLISGLALYFWVIGHGHFSTNCEHLRGDSKEDALKREIELSELGYIRTLAGTVVEIDAVQKTVIVDSDSSGEQKKYKIYTNKDTEFLLFAIQNQNENINTKREDVSDQPQTSSASFDDIFNDASVSVNFNERMDLSKAEKLVAQQLIIIK